MANNPMVQEATTLLEIGASVDAAIDLGLTAYPDARVIVGRWLIALRSAIRSSMTELARSPHCWLMAFR
jgi:hypothetical protein